MTVCRECHGEINARLDFCPRCGTTRSLPADNVPVPAWELMPECPLCQRREYVEKVSKIILHQAKYSHLIEQTKGAAGSTSHLTQDSNAAALLRPLDPPVFPIKKMKAGFAVIGTSLILFYCFSLVSLANFSYDRWFLWPMVFPAGLFIYGAIHGIMELNDEQLFPVRQKIAESRVPGWNKGMKKWHLAYYCRHDRLVFLPEDSISMPIERFHGYLMASESE